VIPDINKRTIVIYISFYFRDENPVGPRGMLRVAKQHILTSVLIKAYILVFILFYYYY